MLVKRDPKTSWSDSELTGLIQEVLAASPWLGEGYRKVWAQLRAGEIRTSQARVLRSMRAGNLLAPTRNGRAHGPKAHDGTINTDRADLMWGTDATATLTEEGYASVFTAVDHCTQECIGIHAALYDSRFEALEPDRQGVREHFGHCTEKIASSLTLRHDNGSRYGSPYFLGELAFLGIRSSPPTCASPNATASPSASSHAQGSASVRATLCHAL